MEGLERGDSSGSASTPNTTGPFEVVQAFRILHQTSDLVAGSVCDREEWSCIGEFKLLYRMRSWHAVGMDGQGWLVW